MTQGPDYQDALRGLKAPEFFASPKYTEQQMRADTVHAHPWIYEHHRCMIYRLRKLKIPMFASEVFRDSARQTQLYVQGFSSVTDGAHQYGLAYDLVHSLRGWELSREQWNLIGHIGKELAISKGFKLVWGGDWTKPWDPAHWEIAKWRENKGSEKWPTPLKAQQQELSRRRL